MTTNNKSEDIDWDLKIKVRRQKRHPQARNRIEEMLGTELTFTSNHF